MSHWCKEHGETYDCAICLTAEVERDERAKCAAEHYTRAEAREMIVRAILYVDPDIAIERDPPVSWACEAAEAIADRILAEHRQQEGKP